jgi:hypothetical protein
MSKQAINLVWFKRDLRLQDHAPLHAAIAQGKPLLLLYCFEPSLLAAPDFDLRHWRFVYQSLEDMNRQLKPFGLEMLVCHDEVVSVLEKLEERYQLEQVFSHQETSLAITYERDKAVKSWLQARDIPWHEYPSNGVVRGLKNRQNWREQLLERHLALPYRIDLADIVPLSFSEGEKQALQGKDLPGSFRIPAPGFQPGGESYAQRYLTLLFRKTLGQLPEAPLPSHRPAGRAVAAFPLTLPGVTFPSGRFFSRWSTGESRCPIPGHSKTFGRGCYGTAISSKSLRWRTGWSSKTSTGAMTACAMPGMSKPSRHGVRDKPATP